MDSWSIHYSIRVKRVTKRDKKLSKIGSIFALFISSRSSIENLLAFGHFLTLKLLLKPVRSFA